MTPAAAAVALACDRVLLVRDGPGLAELAQAIRRASVPGAATLVELDDLYSALGEIATSCEGRAAAVRALAVPLRACGDDILSVRDAIQRLDPRVRLILLAPRGAADVAVEAGFDDVVFLPAGSADLAAALQIELETAEGRGSSRRTPVERIAPSVQPAPDSPLPMRFDRTPASSAPTALSGERDVVEMVIDDAMQAFASRRERAAPPPPKQPELPVTNLRDSLHYAESLGDTDLVDAVLEGGDQLIPTALALVRRETRCDDVRFLLQSDLPRDERPGEVRVPVQWRETTLGVLVSHRTTAQVLEPWAAWMAHWVRLDRAHDELRVLAWTDELTGAGNRRAFERVLEQSIAEARSERRSMTIMYFDIDNFKSYNDRFGHEAGDEVLREVVELLRAVIRRGDHVFRVGGDEFVVIFADSRGTTGAGAPLESVATIADRFRSRVCELKLPQLGIDAPGTLSVSAGVAMYPWDGHDARGLLAHADLLALQSKRSGKNTITFGPGASDHCRDAPAPER